MTPPAFPARLHGLLARDRPVGIVVRRGPSKRAAVYLWDRATDTITLGQWLKGRIYERRCDISPDGRHWIYFAMNGKWEEEAKGAWTAVARAGWLKALAFYPKGDCWEGGGLFTDDDRYWVNDRHFALDPAAYEARRPRRDPKATFPREYGAECPSVYFHRLQRDGWTRLASKTRLRDFLPAALTFWRDDTTIFTKPLPGGGTLVKRAHATIEPPPGAGCYWDEHAVLAPDGTIAEHPDWEWAEVDRDRLVWTEEGRLWAAAAPFDHPILLRDFNQDTFEPIAAPY